MNNSGHKSFNARTSRVTLVSIIAAIGANVLMFYILALARTKPSLTYQHEHDTMRIISMELLAPVDIEPAGKETIPDAVELLSEPILVTSIPPVAEIVPSMLAHLNERIPDTSFNLAGLPVVLPDSSLLQSTKSISIAGIEKPLSARKVDRVPSKIAGAPPRYPQWARRDGLEAVVILRFIVTAQGTARDIKIHDIEGDERFGQSAIEAIAQWRFSPAIKSGKSVACWCFQKITFRLKR